MNEKRCILWQQIFKLKTSSWIRIWIPIQQKSLDLAVLQIRHVYPETRILIFIHLGSRILDPGSQIQQQQQQRKGIRDPGSRKGLFRIPDLGSRIPDPTTTTEEGGKRKTSVPGMDPDPSIIMQK